MISRLSSARTVLQVHDTLHSSRRTLAFRDSTLENEFWEVNWGKNKGFARKGVALSLSSIALQTLTYYVFTVDTQNVQRFWIIRSVMIVCMSAFIGLSFLPVKARTGTIMSVILLAILYAGFQTLEAGAENLFIRELYRTSIINFLFFFLAMQYVFNCDRLCNTFQEPFICYLCLLLCIDNDYSFDIKSGLLQRVGHRILLCCCMSDMLPI